MGEWKDRHASAHNMLYTHLSPPALPKPHTQKQTKQIFPGSKRSHFMNLHKETGVAYRCVVCFCGVGVVAGLCVHSGKKDPMGLFLLFKKSKPSPLLNPHL